ncbi:TetR family transcriptional regulator [Nocardioides sp. TRM66260-LWL]|uniref:acyl-CoA-like ligand-binding transcription factor n=1 Tax=Nocardioides sp. TRM66260-LWL TaxID=2874478 RepID=UPI001CC68642|nr:TetR family transcriptional regulator [Nocardioides sp. TRM66260-LWL]MBZ5735296.1 TetR family transcriptional regulator [Nocardioides sp. TRM66260-LWL]
MSGTRGARLGVTSHAELEDVAFDLFSRLGYEETTMAMIAQHANIGRRTLFRYFASKHDIAWGALDRASGDFVRILEEVGASGDPQRSVIEAIIRFDAEFASDRERHRLRMRLILREPSLQSHSAQRYAEWRHLIAQHVGHLLDLPPDYPLPELAAFSVNAVVVAGYAQWLRDPDADLRATFEDAAAMLRSFWA